MDSKDYDDWRAKAKLIVKGIADKNSDSDDIHKFVRLSISHYSNEIDKLLDDGSGFGGNIISELRSKVVELFDDLRKVEEEGGCFDLAKVFWLDKLSPLYSPFRVFDERLFDRFCIELKSSGEDFPDFLRDLINNHEAVQSKIDAVLKKEKELDDTIKGVNKSKEEADNVLKQIKLLNKEASNAAHDVVAEQMGKYYKEEAVKEDGRADGMYLWLRISMGIALAVVALSVHDTLYVHQDAKWQDLLVKIMATMMASVPAGYFSQELVRHRRKADLYRKIGLDINAIQLYAQALPDEKRHQLIIDKAGVIFGNSVIDSKNESFPVNMPDYVIKLIEALKPQNPADADAAKKKESASAKKES